MKLKFQPRIPSFDSAKLDSPERISYRDPILDPPLSAPKISPPEQTASPIHRLQIRAADVAELSGWFVDNIVRHVAGVPDDHVVAADRFAVNEAVEVRFSYTAVESAPHAIDSIVKLCSGPTLSPGPDPFPFHSEGQHHISARQGSNRDGKQARRELDRVRVCFIRINLVQTANVLSYGSLDQVIQFLFLELF